MINGSPTNLDTLHAAYRYDPWGLPLGSGNYKTGIWTAASGTNLIGAATAEQIANRQVLRYASYICDAESGLYYLTARYYDPKTRQFISPDPVKDDGEASAYQYCQGDPVQSVDPAGMSIITENGWYWCGYVQKDSQVVGVEGEFNVRKCVVNKYGNGTWIGLGGYSHSPNINHLLQAGVDMKRMQTWSEMVPGPNPKYRFKVGQNDQIHIEIRRIALKTHRIKVEDYTNGSTYNHGKGIVVRRFAPEHTADWIFEVRHPQETELYGHFGKLTFNHCRWWAPGGVRHAMVRGSQLYREVPRLGGQGPLKPTIATWEKFTIWNRRK